MSHRLIQFLSIFGKIFEKLVVSHAYIQIKDDSSYLRLDASQRTLSTRCSLYSSVTWEIYYRFTSWYPRYICQHVMAECVCCSSSFTCPAREALDATAGIALLGSLKHTSLLKMENMEIPSSGYQGEVRTNRGLYVHIVNELNEKVVGRIFCIYGNKSWTLREYEKQSYQSWSYKQHVRRFPNITFGIRTCYVRASALYRRRKF